MQFLITSIVASFVLFLNVHVSQPIHESSLSQMNRESSISIEGNSKKCIDLVRNQHVYFAVEDQTTKQTTMQRVDLHMRSDFQYSAFRNKLSSGRCVEVGDCIQAFRVYKGSKSLQTCCKITKVFKNNHPSDTGFLDARDRLQNYICDSPDRPQDKILQAYKKKMLREQILDLDSDFKFDYNASIEDLEKKFQELKNEAMEKFRAELDNTSTLAGWKSLRAKVTQDGFLPLKKEDVIDIFNPSQCEKDSTRAFDILLKKYAISKELKSQYAECTYFVLTQAHGKTCPTDDYIQGLQFVAVNECYRHNLNLQDAAESYKTFFSKYRTIADHAVKMDDNEVTASIKEEVQKWLLNEFSYAQADLLECTLLSIWSRLLASSFVEYFPAVFFNKVIDEVKAETDLRFLKYLVKNIFEAIFRKIRGTFSKDELREAYDAGFFLNPIFFNEFLKFDFKETQAEIKRNFGIQRALPTPKEFKDMFNAQMVDEAIQEIDEHKLNFLQKSKRMQSKEFHNIETSITSDESEYLEAHKSDTNENSNFLKIGQRLSLN